MDTVITVLAYADDMVLIAPTQAGLQQLINITNKWCSKWRLQINSSKTKVMHVRGRSTKKTEYKFTCNSEILDIVNFYKYLGFTLSDDGKVNLGSEILAKARERALGGVINTIKKNGDMSYRTFRKLYDTCVVPVVDYCGGIWGIQPNSQKMLKKVDRVQQRAQRFFLGIDRRSPIARYEGDMPMLKGTECRIINSLRFFNNIVKLPKNRLVRKVFKIGKSLGNNTWAKNVKYWLDQLGMSNAWENETVVDLTSATDKLWKLRETECYEEVLSKPKLRTYATFKKELAVANHITSCIPKKQRSSHTMP